MKFSELWQTALRSIFKNKRRSILTMIGIVIGIAAVVTILAIGHGFSNYTTKTLTSNKSGETKGQIIFNSNTGSDERGQDAGGLVGFDSADVLLVKGVSGVKDAKIYRDTDQNIFQQNYTVNGKTESEVIGLVKKTGSNVQAGRSLTTNDNLLQRKVAVVDSDLAKSIFGNTQAAMGRGIDVNGELYQVVGIRGPVNFSISTAFSNSDASQLSYANIQIPKDTYAQYNRGTSPSSNTLDVTIAKGQKTSTVLNSAVKQLKASGTQRNNGKYQAQDPSEVTDSIGKVLGAVTTFIAAIAGISLFIAGVGVMNMMYISVAERTSEIGIRRAMGATQNNIKLQFLLESATLTIIGGLIGYLLGIGIAAVIGLFLPFPISIDFSSFLLAFSVSTLAGLIFGVMPASSASKKDLIDIIR